MSGPRRLAPGYGMVAVSDPHLHKDGCMLRVVHESTWCRGSSLPREGEGVRSAGGYRREGCICHCGVQACPLLPPGPGRS